MTEPAFTYITGETTRLTATLDSDWYSFEDILGDGLHMQPINFFHDYSRDAFSTDEDHSHQIARLVDAFHYYNHPNNYVELRQRAVGLYLASVGVPYRFVSLRGYSQGEQVDVVLYGNDASDTWILEKDSDKAVQAWFRGDVYTVSLERLVTWRGDNGDIKFEWDVVESVGACLIESDEDLAEHVYNFDLEAVA